MPFFLISKQMTLTTTHRLTIDFGQAEIYIIYKVIISFTINIISLKYSVPRFKLRYSFTTMHILAGSADELVSIDDGHFLKI